MQDFWYPTSSISGAPLFLNVKEGGELLKFSSRPVRGAKDLRLRALQGMRGTLVTTKALLELPQYLMPRANVSALYVFFFEVVLLMLTFKFFLVSMASRDPEP